MCPRMYFAGGLQIEACLGNKQFDHSRHMNIVKLQHFSILHQNETVAQYYEVYSRPLAMPPLGFAPENGPHQVSNFLWETQEKTIFRGTWWGPFYTLWRGQAKWQIAILPLADRRQILLEVASPQNEIANLLANQAYYCCGRVDQSGLHIAHGKNEHGLLTVSCLGREMLTSPWGRFFLGVFGFSGKPTGKFQFFTGYDIFAESMCI